MDLAGPNSRFDILQIYRKYCDIVSRNTHVCDGGDDDDDDDQSKKANSARDELVELLKVVESWVNARISIYDELQNLMSRLGVMENLMELSRFYDFVFFTCRENGQKNISVSRAITAWKLVLVGRFRLLNQWCDFVQKYQRHNISEDTWRQVLAFSWCVHENLEGYDPEGAWPVLIDEFVEFMYRVNGPNDAFQSQTSTSNHSLPGLKLCSGFKRKMTEGRGILKSTDPYSHKKHLLMFKKLKQIGFSEGQSPTAAIDGAKHSSPMKPANSPCEVERGSLSKGFAGLFTTGSSFQVDGKSYT